MCIKFIISKKTSPLLDSFFNPKSFNFFTDIYSASTYLMRIIKHKIKHKKMATFLSSHTVIDGVAQTGRDKSGDTFSSPCCFSFATGKNYSMNQWKADGTPYNMLEDEKNNPKEERTTLQEERAKLALPFEWLLSAINFHACLRDVLSATFIVCTCMKFPSLPSPCFQLPPLLFFLFFPPGHLLITGCGSFWAGIRGNQHKQVMRCPPWRRWEFSKKLTFESS